MFKGFFKPLSKRDAKIASVLFGIVLIILAYNVIKDLFAGMSFDEVRSNILLVAFLGIIEWGMVVIATSKDKDESASSEDASPQSCAALPEGSEETEGSEEFTEEFGADDSGADDGEAV